MSRTERSDVLSVLIVGCGQIAGGYDVLEDLEVKTHVKAYLGHAGFRLAGCVDPDLQKARAFAERWRIPAAFADLTAASGGSYDVVSVCSPPAAHAGQLQALLDWDVRGVFCEKPLTTDASVSRLLVQAYRQQNRPLAVNYLRRWEPETSRVCADIAAGRWGRLLHAHGVYTKGIYANGGHLIDLLQMLVGPLTPIAVTDCRIDYLRDDPSLGGLLRTADGAPVVLSLGDCRRFTIFELDLLFEVGRVTFGDSGWTLCERRVIDDPRYAGYRILEPALSRRTGMGTAMSAAVANLHACLTAGHELASTGQTALASQMTCESLHAMADAAQVEGSRG